MFDRLRSHLDGFIGNGTPGYDMCIMKDGQVVYRRYNGLSDVENGIKMNGNELYFMYSVSKVITVTAALQLYEKGVFDLDDKLEKYLPEYAEMQVKTEDGSRAATKPITVKDLFCMTAGFSYRMKNPAVLKFREETGERCPTREFARYMADAVLDFEPGEKWQYSLCHDVLGSFIEIWTGKKFGEYVKENIFDPLGMRDTTFYLPPEERHKLCPQYRYNGNDGSLKLEGPINVYSMWPEYESGGGGCVSTVEDMMKFGEGLRTGKLLKPETIEMMTTNQIAHCIDSFTVERYGYGLGVRCSRGGDGISDFGWGGAGGAGIWIDAKNGLVAFYAQHVLNTPLIKKRNNLILLIKECLGLGTGDASDAKPADKEREEFAAKYGV